MRRANKMDECRGLILQYEKDLKSIKINSIDHADTLAALGKEYYDNRSNIQDKKRAMECYDESIKIYKKNNLLIYAGNSFRLKGDIYRENESYTNAINLYKEGVKCMSVNIFDGGDLVTTSVEGNKSTIKKDFPKVDVQALIGLQKLLCNLGLCYKDKAIKVFESDNTTANECEANYHLLYRSLVYFKRSLLVSKLLENENKHAEKILKKEIAEMKFSAIYNIGSVQHEAGNYFDSIETYNKAIEEAKSKISTSIGDNDWSIVCNDIVNKAELGLGLSYLKLYKYEEALRHANVDLKFCRQQSVKMKNKDVQSRNEAYLNEGKSHLNVGIIKDAKGDFEDALLCYDNAIECFKRSTESQGDIDDAKVNIQVTKEFMKIDSQIKAILKKNTRVLNSIEEDQEKSFEILESLRNLYDEYRPCKEKIENLRLLLKCALNLEGLKLKDKNLVASIQYDYGMALYKYYASTEDEEKLEKSVTYLKEAASYFSENNKDLEKACECWDAIGNALSAANIRLDEQIDYYLKAIKSHTSLSSRIISYNNMIISLNNAGKFNDARKYLKALNEKKKEESFVEKNDFCDVFEDNLSNTLSDKADDNDDCDNDRGCDNSSEESNDIIIRKFKFNHRHSDDEESDKEMNDFDEIDRLIFNCKSSDDSVQSLKHELREAIENCDLKWQMSIYSSLGDEYDRIGEYLKSLSCYSKYYEISLKYDDLDISALALRKKAVAQRNYGLLQDSMSTLKHALSIAKTIANKQDIFVELGNSLFSVYDDLDKEFEDREAFNYCDGIKLDLLNAYTNASQLAYQLGNKERISNAHHNLGLFYSSVENDYAEALKQFEDALKVNEQTKNEHQKGRIYWGKGEALGKLKRYEEAIYFLEIDRKICNKLGDIAGERDAESKLGDILLETKDYKKGLLHHQKYLGLANKLKDDVNHQKIAGEKVKICKEAVDISTKIKAYELKKKELKQNEYFNEVALLLEKLEKLNLPDWEKSEQLAREWMQYFNNSQDALMLLSRSLYALKKFQDAIFYSGKILKIKKEANNILDCALVQHNIANAMEEYVDKLYTKESIIKAYEEAFEYACRCSNENEAVPMQLEILHNLKVFYIKWHRYEDLIMVISRADNLKNAISSPQIKRIEGDKGTKEETKQDFNFEQTSSNRSQHFSKSFSGDCVVSQPESKRNTRKGERVSQDNVEGNETRIYDDIDILYEDDEIVKINHLNNKRCHSSQNSSQVSSKRRKISRQDIGDNNGEVIEMGVEEGEQQRLQKVDINEKQKLEKIFNNRKSSSKDENPEINEFKCVRVILINLPLEVPINRDMFTINILKKKIEDLVSEIYGTRPSISQITNKNNDVFDGEDLLTCLIPEVMEDNFYLVAISPGWKKLPLSEAYKAECKVMNVEPVEVIYKKLVNIEGKESSLLNPSTVENDKEIDKLFLNKLGIDMNLSSCNLSDCSIVPILRTLSLSNNLNTFILDNNLLSNQTLIELTHLFVQDRKDNAFASLKTLSLSFIRSKDDELSKLIVSFPNFLKQLRTLNLSGLPLGSLTCTAIANAFPFVPLSFLNLSSCFVEKDNFMHIVQAIKGCFSLIELDFSKNYLEANSFHELCCALAIDKINLTKLNFSHCSISGADYVIGDALSKLVDQSSSGLPPPLVELNLKGIQNLKEHFCAAFSKTFLYKKQTIQKIDISCCGLSSDATKMAFSTLSNSTSLTSLNVSWNQIDVSLICDSLCKDNCLSHVNISGIGMTSVGLSLLVDVLGKKKKKIKELDLSFNFVCSENEDQHLISLNKKCENLIYKKFNHSI